MKKSIFKTLLLAASLSAILSFTALAGEWKQDTTGWWYVNDDNSYPTNQWVWIDGNGDGVSESYYFDSNGYCLQNITTPDGYTVNGDGAWVVDGIIQTQAALQQPTALPNTQPPIKLKTDFIKQEFIDILGKDKSYAMERLAAYNPYYDTSEVDGNITCDIDDMTLIMVGYDDNDIVNNVYGLNGAIFNGSVENESDLDAKLGGGMTADDGIGIYTWILSESPHIELDYMPAYGYVPSYFNLYYGQYY